MGSNAGSDSYQSSPSIFACETCPDDHDTDLQEHLKLYTQLNLGWLHQTCRPKSILSSFRRAEDVYSAGIWATARALRRPLLDPSPTTRIMSERKQSQHHPTATVALPEGG